MITSYEWTRLLMEPFLTPLHRLVRRVLVELTEATRQPVELLDVGGRKSPYTIGLNAGVTILDLPRETAIQHALNLGVNEPLANRIRRQRSNIRQVLVGDMTCSTLPDASFDAAVAVEVLEHVDEDKKFLEEVARVVRPGGWFLMTTPNGDFVPNVGNPDHRRHYRREQLQSLLNEVFVDVKVRYAIRHGRFHRAGLRSWSFHDPVGTIASMLGNFVNDIQSAPTKVGEQSVGTGQLLAVASVARGVQVDRGGM